MSLLVCVLFSLMGCPRQAATPSSSLVTLRRVNQDMGAVKAHLQAAAGSTDPIVRAQALSGLAQLPGAEGEQYLLRGVLDPSVWVQRAMARSVPFRTANILATRPHSDPVALAVALAGLSIEKRREIVVKLGRTHSGDLVAGALLGNEDLLQALQDRAQEGDVPPEEDLFWAMGQTGSVVLGQALMDGIPHAEDLIRVQMALVAQYLAPKHASGALRDALSSAPLEQRLEAVEGLVEYDTPAGRQFLIRASRGPEGPVRVHSQLALVALTGGPISLATEALISPDRDVRAWAATCLMLVGTERPLHRSLVPALITAQQDEAPAVRMAAVRALLVVGAVEGIMIPDGFWSRKPDTVSTMIAASLWSSTHA
jgi:hypothetical protein